MNPRDPRPTFLVTFRNTVLDVDVQLHVRAPNAASAEYGAAKLLNIHNIDILGGRWQIHTVDLTQAVPA